MAALIPALIRIFIRGLRGGGGGGGGGGGSGKAPREPADPNKKHQDIWQGKLMGLVDDDIGGRMGSSKPQDPWGDLPAGKHFDKVRGL